MPNLTRPHRFLALFLALALLLLLGGKAKGDEGLTSLVSDAFLSRTVSAELHEIAHQRAVESSRDFSHDAMRPGTAEVLAWNSGFPDPVGHAVEQWLTSPDHFAILSDPTLTLIGCGSYFDGEAYFFACVLAAGPPAVQSVQPPPVVQVAPSSAPAVVLPDTAMGAVPTYRLFAGANYLL